MKAFVSNHKCKIPIEMFDTARVMFPVCDQQDEMLVEVKGQKCICQGGRVQGY